MYLQAIESGGGAYTLDGILARGSARSHELAQRYRVPLYGTVEEVPQGIDLACAAMGPSGTETVLELLSRRIHVLCEHPQKADYLETALTTAAAHGVCFHLNGHFAALDASQAFIERAAQLRRSQRPAFVDATVTDRSLYGALDVLRAALDSFQPFEFDLTSSLPPFAVVQGTLGGVRATIQVQRSDKDRSEARSAIPDHPNASALARLPDAASLSPKEEVEPVISRGAGDTTIERNNDAGMEGASLADGSTEYLVEYRIAMGFPTGVLTLLAPGGPVVWNSSLYRRGATGALLWELANSARSVSFSELHQQRVVANLRSMSALLNNARQGPVPEEQKPEYILEIGRAWEAIGRKLRR